MNTPPINDKNEKTSIKALCHKVLSFSPSCETVRKHEKTGGEENGNSHPILTDSHTNEKEKYKDNNYIYTTFSFSQNVSLAKAKGWNRLCPCVFHGLPGWLVQHSPSGKYAFERKDRALLSVDQAWAEDTAARGRK